ncbi:MAG: PHP domain-containing protein [Bacillota bacterium]
MKVAFDLHIHTALSPCGDNDMTPNNIVNMSILKGLDVIAVTDHNSAENCKSCLQAAEGKDIIVIPGMELQTREEVHLLCLFQSLDAVLDFQNLIYSKATNEKNSEKLFGKQLIFDAEDHIIGTLDKLLISSINISVKDACQEVLLRDGIVIPAHVDKSTYSMIANLGFIPPNLPIKSIEIANKSNQDVFLQKNSYLKKYNVIHNSDAHYLWHISEKENFLEVQEKHIESIFKVLNS